MCCLYAVRWFQFYLSSIKSSQLRPRNRNTNEFQFYLSSIKSEIEACYGEHICLFQFYLSSIKSQRSRLQERHEPGFNSTLVQLKVIFER